MGPIPGISWRDVAGIVADVVLVVALLWVQSSFVDASPTGPTRTLLDRLAVPSVVPVLFIAVNRAWLAIPVWVGIAALVSWFVEIELVRRRARSYRGDLRAARDAAELAEARAAGGPIAPPGVVAASMAAAEPVPMRRRKPWRRRLTLLIVAGFIAAPGAVAAVRDQTPCEEAEVVLAGQTPTRADASPDAWVPDAVPGYVPIDARATTLDMVAASRKDPEESRRELTADGFVGGYEGAWHGVSGHIEFEAQRFATQQGAVAFQAFATRYACAFANVSFRSQDGAVGLQIRYAFGLPFGEQLSWVSGPTRIIVFVDFPSPPPNHAEVESLASLVRP